MNAPIIQVLPPHIASKIAAGEVIQRASSIVKELLENALDAGSTFIKVVVDKTDCTNFIQVVDNGSGMSDQDAQLCTEAHATSKISQPEDLFSLDTYGFRGEALNAIAAVAELTIITRTKEEELGTYLALVDGQVKKKKPMVTPVGTKVEVRHLFGSIPGRRGFLKSNAIELKHILTTFQQIALANTNVGFAFYNGQGEHNKLYDLPPTKLSYRIVNLFNKGYAKQLIPCEERTKYFHLKGYIGSPERAKRKSGEQFLFVNQRYIKNHFLKYAVRQGYQNSLPTNHYPFFVLFINVPPDHVDVNVHPAKVEVKFQDERLLYTLITAAVKKALLMYHGMHTINLTGEDTKAIFAAPTPVSEEMPPIDSAPLPSTTQADHDLAPETASTQVAGTTAPSPPAPSTTYAILSTPAAPPTITPPLSLQEALFQKPLPTPAYHPHTAKLQLHHQFMLAQVKSGLLVVDQYAAYERILYECNIQQFKQPRGAQKLIFPYKLTLQPADLMLVKACQEELYALGFRFEINLPSTLKITGQPINSLNLPQYNTTEQVIMNLLGQYKIYTKMDTLPSQERWARALAKRHNLAPNSALSAKEMDALIDQLFACENPNLTPDGDKIWRILPLDKLDKWLHSPAPSVT